MKNLYWLCLLAALILGGCGSIQHHVTIPENKPIALGSNLGPGTQYALVRPFGEKERQIYFLFHFFPINHANGINAAEKHLHEGDGIANLRIKTYIGPVDVFFSMITAGLITTYTIDTHGDIIRLTAPLPPPRL